MRDPCARQAGFIRNGGAADNVGMHLKILGAAIVAAGLLIVLAGCDELQGGGAQGDTLYGAIAIADAWPACVQRAKGFVWNYETLSAAQRAALELCLEAGDASCQVEFTWSNGCAALAESTTCGVGMGSSQSRTRAESLALSQCTGPNCRITFSECTS